MLVRILKFTTMKKLMFIFAVCLSAISLQLHAQEKTLGFFNSMSVGVNVGTTGWGIDVAAPINQYLSLRAGFTTMPKYSVTDELDVDVNTYGYYNTHSMEVEGSVGRTSGEVLLNLYPFKRSSFFITGGAVFGGNKVIKLNGHSDELAQYQNMAGQYGVEIGDYIIPIDKNGNVSGGIKVASFRPYIGLGFGRIVPKNKRVGFLFEIGAQIHGTPEVYTNFGSLNTLLDDADNEFTDIMNMISVYPVLRFRLCGKIF